MSGSSNKYTCKNSRYSIYNLIKQLHVTFKAVLEKDTYWCCGAALDPRPQTKASVFDICDETQQLTAVVVVSAVAVMEIIAVHENVWISGLHYLMCHTQRTSFFTEHFMLLLCHSNSSSSNSARFNIRIFFYFTRKCHNDQDLFYRRGLSKVAAVQHHNTIKCIKHDIQTTAIKQENRYSIAVAFNTMPVSPDF